MIGFANGSKLLSHPEGDPASHILRRLGYERVISEEFASDSLFKVAAVATI